MIYTSLQTIEDGNGILPTMCSLDETILVQDNINDDNSRVLLYYASTEAVVSASEQNDVYG